MAGGTPRRGAGKSPKRTLARAQEAHRRGAAEEAERLYRRVLESAPAHRDALHNLGVLAQQRGDLEAAAVWLERAVAAAPGDAALLNNLGSVQRGLGRRAEALASYRAALAHEPSHANALYNLATLLQESGEPAAAVDCLRRLIGIAPDDAEAWSALGMALLETGANDEALAGFERAVALRPRDAVAHYNLANARRQLGLLDEAARGYREAVSLAPAFAEAQHNLGMVSRLLGDLDAAESAFRAAVACKPGHAKAWAGLARVVAERGANSEALELLRGALEHLPGETELMLGLGERLLDMDRFEEAARAFEDVVSRDPGHAGALNGLSKAYTRLHRTAAAIEACRRAIAHDARFADAHCNLGLALRQRGDVEGAVEAYRAAIDLSPDYAEAYNNLGLAYVDLGQAALGSEQFRKALELDPAMTEACLNLARAERCRDVDAEELRYVESLLGEARLDDDRANLHFALGKMYDDCARYDLAFAHYRDANRHMRKRTRFDPDHYQRWLARFAAVFTPALFERLRGAGLDSERPVFIVGMPRSGTTLVEQIIASHPLVHGGDELTKFPELVEEAERALGSPPGYPDCVEALDDALAGRLARAYLDYLDWLDGEALRVTDKMPSNFFHLGMIAIVLPRARIIHCRRDAMDVCLSNYMQRFAEGHYYSYDLSDTACYYQGYERIMALWREVLPMRMFEVQYEELVEDQERVSRALVDYCGLEWDERCLAFYETRRAVRTASNWQVRQPMYKEARRRWRNYEPFLGELRRGLGLVQHEDGT